MLANAVLRLLREGRDFTKENLEATYVADRRASALDRRLRRASGARNGFNKSFFWGMVGEGLRGMLGIALPFRSVPPASRVPDLEKALKGRRCDREKLKAGVEAAEKARRPLHDAVMDACGWPPIPFDGALLMQHQDALLLGGKVQAAPGFADHVTFADPGLCRECSKHTCIEVCSAQALMPASRRSSTARSACTAAAASGTARALCPAPTTGTSCSGRDPAGSTQTRTDAA